MTDRYCSKYFDKGCKIWVEIKVGAFHHTKGINFNRIIVTDDIIGFYNDENLIITFDVKEIRLKVYHTNDGIQYDLTMIR